MKNKISNSKIQKRAFIFLVAILFMQTVTQVRSEPDATLFEPGVPKEDHADEWFAVKFQKDCFSCVMNGFQFCGIWYSNQKQTYCWPSLDGQKDVCRSELGKKPDDCKSKTINPQYRGEADVSDQAKWDPECNYTYDLSWKDKAKKHPPRLHILNYGLCLVKINNASGKTWKVSITVETPLTSNERRMIREFKLTNTDEIWDKQIDTLELEANNRAQDKISKEMETVEAENLEKYGTKIAPNGSEGQNIAGAKSKPGVYPIEFIKDGDLDKEQYLEKYKDEYNYEILSGTGSGLYALNLDKEAKILYKFKIELTCVDPLC